MDNEWSEKSVARKAPTSGSLRGRLVSDLRAKIGGGLLSPGLKLNERELCERFGVSRPTVREAMHQLAGEGFVEIEANKGAVVADISYDRAGHLFELRGALEGLACELCAMRSSLDTKRRLSRAVDAVASAMSIGKLETVIAAKDEFYVAVLDGAGNPDLSALLQLLHVRIRILRRYSLQVSGRHAESLAEIRAIVSAIVAGDACEAGKAARHHVAQARNAALPRIFDQKAMSA